MAGKLILLGVIIANGHLLQGIICVKISLLELDDCKKSLVKEFHDMVDNDLDLPIRRPYTKKDAYLLRFLAVKNFHLPDAVHYLRQNLAWREANKIDSILDEDWSDFDKRFPYELSSVTKDGRPVLYRHFGKWNVSDVIASGDDTRFVRYASAKMMEDADQRVRSILGENYDVAQFDKIVNMEGVTKEAQGCKQCHLLFLKIVQLSEIQYGGAVDNIFFVNAPPELENFLRLVNDSTKHDDLRPSLSFFGGRNTWEPVLLRYIDREELPTDLQ